MERDFYTRELLTQKPAVLLLGSGAELTAFVHALNKDYNIEPRVYAESRFAFIPGLSRGRFQRIKHPGNEYYIIHTLLDFYSESDDARQTALLIPCTPYYVDLVARNTRLLEPYFIIESLKNLMDVLPSLMPKAKKKVKMC